MLQVGPVRSSIPSRQLGRGPRVGSVHEDPWMSVQISARIGGCKGRRGLPGVKAGQATCMGWWASQVPVRTVPPPGGCQAKSERHGRCCHGGPDGLPHSLALHSSEHGGLASCYCLSLDDPPVPTWPARVKLPLLPA